MFSLLTEVHFFGSGHDVQIRPTDLAAFRLSSRKEATQDLHETIKEVWANNRNIRTTSAIRRRLRRLEEAFRLHSVVSISWPSGNHLRIVFSSGLICTTTISSLGGSPSLVHISFDKYLVGKLVNDRVHQVLFSRSYVIISYVNVHQLTVLHIGKPATRFPGIDKLSKLEPRLTHVDLAGNKIATAPRNLSPNVSGDLLLVWWQSSTTNPPIPQAQPWQPAPHSAADRHPIHIYSLTPLSLRQAEPVALLRPQGLALYVAFSSVHADRLWMIEQVANGVEVGWWAVAGGKRGLVRGDVTCVGLRVTVRCWAVSTAEEMVAFGCVDGSIAVFETRRCVTRLVKSSFVPVALSWHRDGALLMAISELGQIQVYDSALSLVRIQLISDDVTPSTLIDLSCYFTRQPMVCHLCQTILKPNAEQYNQPFAPMDSLVAICFVDGPVALLSFVGGGGLHGDIAQPGFTHDVLIRMYLMYQQLDRAVALLAACDWDIRGAISLAGLYHILNFITRSGKLTPDKSSWLEIALGTFLAPQNVPWSQATLNEFSDQVHDVARRFFHLLLRYDYNEKAYRLAIDLRDADLFADLLRYALHKGDGAMAEAVRGMIEEIFEVASEQEGEECSSCSNTSSAESEEGELPPLPSVPVIAKKQPPLPDFSKSQHLLRHGKLRESAFFTKNPATLFNFIIPEEESDADQSTPTTMILTPEMPVNHVIEELYNLPARPDYFSSYRPRQKVKFSDTVTQIVVPNVSKPTARYPDATRELKDDNHSESLDHLTSSSSSSSSRSGKREESNGQGGTIKVIHFGVV